MVQQAQSRQLIDTSSNTSKRVHAVFNRLKPYANEANNTGVPFIWQMTVVKSDDMNAWAMPGGKMMVYTGIVDKLNLTDDEIAAVVGHEMSTPYTNTAKKRWVNKYSPATPALAAAFCSRKPASAPIRAESGLRHSERIWREYAVFTQPGK